MQIEKRSVPGELRTEQTSGKTYLIGRAASYNVMSHLIFGFYREIIQPGAFDDVLADPKLDVVHNINHDPSQVLGRTTSGTTKLTFDSRGLAYRTLLPDTSYAEDLAVLCERGDISESSFSFVCGEDTWSDIEDSDDPNQRCALRTITRIESLHDVSTVCSAAYPSTDAQLASRSLPATMPTELRNRILAARAADDTDKCACDCPECQDGDCEACSMETCSDDVCRENGCPMQQAAGSDAEEKMIRERKLRLAMME